MSALRVVLGAMLDAAEIARRIQTRRRRRVFVVVCGLFTGHQPSELVAGNNNLWRNCLRCGRTQEADSE